MNSALQNAIPHDPMGVGSPCSATVPTTGVPYGASYRFQSSSPPSKRGSNLACLNCRKIKTKCEKAHPTDERCKRCVRLDLHCEYRAHHRGKKLKDGPSPILTQRKGSASSGIGSMASESSLTLGPSSTASLSLSLSLGRESSLPASTPNSAVLHGFAHHPPLPPSPTRAEMASNSHANTYQPPHSRPQSVAGQAPPLQPHGDAAWLAPSTSIGSSYHAPFATSHSYRGLPGSQQAVETGFDQASGQEASRWQELPEAYSTLTSGGGSSSGHLEYHQPPASHFGHGQQEGASFFHVPTVPTVPTMEWPASAVGSGPSPHTTWAMAEAVAAPPSRPTSASSLPTSWHGGTSGVPSVGICSSTGGNFTTQLTRLPPYPAELHHEQEATTSGYPDGSSSRTSFPDAGVLAGTAMPTSSSPASYPFAMSGEMATLDPHANQAPYVAMGSQNATSMPLSLSVSSRTGQYGPVSTLSTGRDNHHHLHYYDPPQAGSGLADVSNCGTGFYPTSTDCHPNEGGPQHGL